MGKGDSFIRELSMIFGLPIIFGVGAAILSAVSCGDSKQDSETQIQSLEPSPYFNPGTEFLSVDGKRRPITQLTDPNTRCDCFIPPDEMSDSIDRDCKDKYLLVAYGADLKMPHLEECQGTVFKRRLELIDDNPQFKVPEGLTEYDLLEKYEVYFKEALDKVKAGLPYKDSLLRMFSYGTKLNYSPDTMEYHESIIVRTLTKAIRDAQWHNRGVIFRLNGE
jgi:hypothetical protein